MNDAARSGEPGAQPTLASVLQSLCAPDEARAALLSPEGEVATVADLARDVAAMASALAGAGVTRQQRVLTVATSGIGDARAILATACTATAVPTSPGSTAAEFAHLIAATDASAICAWGALPQPLADVARRERLPTIELSSLPRGGRSPQPREAPLAADTALLMHTSGTTSRPKLVPITHATLIARARKTQSLLGIGRDDRCLCLMPLHLMHGINSGLLGPLLCGGSVILPSTVTRESFRRALAQGATWYTAGAAHQQSVLRWVTADPEIATTHALRFVRSGSASLAPALAQSLEHELGVPVFESYSSTETGTITANSPSLGRKLGTVGRSTLDDIAIADPNGRLLPRGETGEVVVRGETLSLPYEGDAQTAASAFRDGWFHTGDLGNIDAEGYLTLRGRLKDQINRGGQKVSPAELDAALLGLPDVIDAATFPVPHPSLGEDVAAAVVLQQGSPGTETSLLSALGEVLSAAKMPRRIVVVQQIPRADGNKLRRRELANLFADQLAARDPANAQASSPLEARILDLWRNTLKRPDLPLDANFFLSGGDSLAGVELAETASAMLGTRVLLSDISRFPTAAAFFEAFLKGSLGTRADTLAYNAEGQLRPLFAVAARDGHATRFAALGHGMRRDLPLYAMQPPGMDWSTAGCDTVEQMAAHYLERVRAMQPRGPYRLFGSSFGGIVVFEMALQLQRAGEVVELLMMSDSVPPNARIGVRRCQPFNVEEVAPLPLGPQGRSVALARQDAQRVADAHSRARGLYVARERFAGQIVFLLSSGEPVAAGLDSRRWWRHLATQGLRLFCLPGPHASFHHSPQYESTLAVLNALGGSEPLPSDDPQTIFDPRMRLAIGPAGRLLGVKTIHGSLIPLAGKARGQVAGYVQQPCWLRLSGWASGPDGKSPARWVLAFLNGRFVGRVGTGLPSPAGPSQGFGPPPPRHSGFQANLPLRNPPSGTASPRITLLVQQDGRAVYAL